MNGRFIEILLVEDNPGDADLAREAFAEGSIESRIHWVEDGIEALDFLRHEEGFENAPRPDLILLDLNLPRCSGREVLAEIKSDPKLRTIPVVVLTSSERDRDIVDSYDLHANCYVSKPVDFPQFVSVVRGIQDFWLTVVKLPGGGESRS
ncbi:MAG: response regulator [Proteobacteria bacterium]|nr:response regulator [Pseudomonadota bacterium]